jgi:hypothetical protein
VREEQIRIQQSIQQLCRLTYSPKSDDGRHSNLCPNSIEWSSEKTKLSKCLRHIGYWSILYNRCWFQCRSRSDGWTPNCA